MGNSKTTNGNLDLDWWDELVEGKREEFDLRVNETGNPPNAQPTEPKSGPGDIPNKVLPLAQPRDQGTTGGNKVAGSKGANNDDWATTATTGVIED